MSPEILVVTPPHGGSFEVARARARQAKGHVPLLLVPGIGGPRGAFHHQLRTLTEERDVVATSLNPAQAPGLKSIPSSARDVLHVLDALAIERADLLGASYGSCVTACLSELAPERVRRQLWVAPPVVRHAPWRAAFGPGWLLGGALMKFAPVRYRDDIVRWLAERRIYSVEPDLPEEELLRLAGRVSDTELAPFFRRFADLRAWDWKERSRAVTRPLLVIQGRKEHTVTPPDVRQAWEHASGRPIALIDGTHMPYLSYPQQFNDAVQGFLEIEERALDSVT